MQTHLDPMFIKKHQSPRHRTRVVEDKVEDLVRRAVHDECKVLVPTRVDGAAAHRGRLFGAVPQPQAAVGVRLQGRAACACEVPSAT